MVAGLSASSLASDQVKNLRGEDLGKIGDSMIDLKSGRVVYRTSTPKVRLSAVNLLGNVEKSE